MEQEPLEEKRECCEHTEEADSPVSSPWSSTENDSHIEEADPLESSPQSSTDNDRETEEEDEAEPSDKPTGR